MGAKSSTQVASDDINTDSKTTENCNFGLINLSSESLSGGNAVATHDGSAMPMVQPVASRVPVLSAPPPVYPGDALASVGKQMMQQYE